MIMKNKFIYILAVSMLITFSCEQEILELEAPESPSAGCNSCPEGASAGPNLSFAKFVSIGNGFVAGFQAGALFNNGQANSMAKLLAKQLECAGGSATFNQPDINSVNGYNIQLSNPPGLILGRLVLFDPDGSGPRTASPTPAGFPGSPAPDCPPGGAATPALPAPFNTADLPSPYTGDKDALNNYGVPFLFLGQALIPDTGNPGAGALYNGLWARFAKEPGAKSIIQESLAAAGSFYLIWLGIEDAILYAATGATGAYPLTSAEDFGDQYELMITNMLAANPNFKGVVGNIPSVSSFPYFTTISWNQLKLSAEQVAQLTPLAEGYNTALLNLKNSEIISEAEYNKRLLTYTVSNTTTTATDLATRTAVLIEDEYLTDLSPYLPNELDHLAKARQATANDLLPLTAGSVLGTCFSGQATAIYGVSYPLPDQYVLVTPEIVEIETEIAGYNVAIAAAVENSNNRLALADVKTAYNNLLMASANPNTRGLLIDGVTIASSLQPPAGIFSEDGIHPNARGNAFTANIFIDAINNKFDSDVPKICMTQYSGTGLPINP